MLEIFWELHSENKHCRVCLCVGLSSLLFKLNLVITAPFMLTSNGWIDFVVFALVIRSFIFYMTYLVGSERDVKACVT